MSCTRWRASAVRPFWRTRCHSPMANLNNSALPGLVAVTRASPAERGLQGRFAALLDVVSQNRPNEDVEILRRAFEFAAEQHQSQTRESGEPYLSHPLEVAHILADLRLDVTTLAPG